MKDLKVEFDRETGEGRQGVTSVLESLRRISEKQSSMEVLERLQRRSWNGGLLAKVGSVAF